MTHQKTNASPITLHRPARLVTTTLLCVAWLGSGGCATTDSNSSNESTSPPPLSASDQPKAQVGPEADASTLRPPHVEYDQPITLSDRQRWEGVTTRLDPADGSVSHYPIYVRSAGQVVRHTAPTQVDSVEGRMLVALGQAHADDYDWANVGRLTLEPAWAFVQVATIPPRMLVIWPWLPRTTP